MELQTPEDRVNLVVDGGNYTLFFRCDDRVYAANESGRVTFAKILDPNDVDYDDRKNAFFQAVDLGGIAEGKQAQKIFGVKQVERSAVLTPRRAKQLALGN